MQVINAALGVSIGDSSSGGSSGDVSIATTSVAGIVKVPTAGGLTVSTVGSLAVNVGSSLKISSGAVVVDPDNLDVTTLKNASTLVIGQYEGEINSSSALSDFADSTKGSFWIYTGISSLALGDQTFATGDQLWCKTTFTGTPTDLTTNFSLVPNTIGTATTSTYGTVQYGSDTPLVDSQYGSVGTAVGVARIDHSHPYLLMTGATSSDAGTAGYILTPAAGDQYHPFLGGGTYSSIDLDGVKVSAVGLILDSNDTNGYLSVAGTNYFGWNKTSIYPITTSSYDLGTDTLAFNEVHGNTVESASDSALTLNSSSGSGVMSVADTAYYNWGTGSFSPVNTGAQTLGESGLAWLAGYFDSVIAGAGTFSSTLTVTGALTANGGVSSTTGSFSSTLSATGATTLSSTLAVTGNTAIAGYLTVGTSTQNTSYKLYVSGNMSATGAAEFGSTMAVVGNTTVTGILYANGGMTSTTGVFSSTLAVTGAVSMYSSLSIAGDVLFSSTLTVGGASTFSNTVGISGVLTVSSISSASSNSLTLNGTDTGGNLQVAGTTYYNWSTSAFYPTANSAKNLGSSTNSWYTTYTNSIISNTTSLGFFTAANGGFTFGTSSTNILKISASSIYPITTNSMSLGLSGYVFTTTYTNYVTSGASTSLVLRSTGGTGYLQSSSTNVFYWTATAFGGMTNNAWYIGTSSNAAITVYSSNITSAASTALYLNATGGGGYLQSAATNAIGWTSSAIFPATSGAATIGTSSLPFGSAYINGLLTVGASLSSSCGIELGSQVATSTPYIDFHSSGLSTNDYDARIICQGGSSTSGSGSLLFYGAVHQFTGNLTASATTCTIGTSSALWGQIYSTSSTISTSDARKKTDFQQLPDDFLDYWSENLSIRSWLWNDGNPETRRLIGTTAQEVIACFDNSGLDWHEWHIMTLADDGFYLLCYDEFQTIELAALRRENQKLKDRIEKIESLLGLLS